MDLARTLRILCRAADRAAGSVSLEDGCAAIVQAAHDALRCHTAVVLLLEGGTLRLKTIVHRGLSDHFAYHYRPDLDENPTLDRVVRGGKRVSVPVPEDDQAALADLAMEEDAASVLAVPIRSGSVGVGCLLCADPAPDLFDRTAATLACLLGHLASSLYTRHTLGRRQRDLLITDAETGAYSFDFFCTRLGEEIARANRYTHGLGLLVVETDRLDRFEQMHGGAKAGRALKQMLRIAADQLRPVDTVGRYHMRQMTICLPETDEAGAAAAAERLREAVAAHDFGHAEPRLTLSVGATAYRPDDTVQGLIRRGERALHRARLAGGNQVVTAEA